MKAKEKKKLEDFWICFIRTHKLRNKYEKFLLLKKIKPSKFNSFILLQLLQEQKPSPSCIQFKTLTTSKAVDNFPTDLIP